MFAKHFFISSSFRSIFCWKSEVDDLKVYIFLISDLDSVSSALSRADTFFSSRRIDLPSFTSFSRVYFYFLRISNCSLSFFTSSAIFCSYCPFSVLYCSSFIEISFLNVVTSNVSSYIIFLIRAFSFSSYSLSNPFDLISSLFLILRFSFSFLKELITLSLVATSPSFS